MCRTVQYNAIGRHQILWYSQRSWNSTHYWSYSHVSDSDRRRILDIFVFNFGRSKDGHATRFRHAKTASGMHYFKYPHFLLAHWINLDALFEQCTIDLTRNLLVIGTTSTETPFLPESELPESARLSWNKSEGTLENEGAIDALGGEDIGLAKAIEESVRQQKSNKQGHSSKASASAKSPVHKKQRKQ